MKKSNLKGLFKKTLQEMWDMMDEKQREYARRGARDGGIRNACHVALLCPWVCE